MIPRRIDSYLPTWAAIPLEVARELIMRWGIIARAASKPAVEIRIRTHGVVPNKARVHTITPAAVHKSVYMMLFCVLIGKRNDPNFFARNFGPMLPTMPPRRIPATATICDIETCGGTDNVLVAADTAADTAADIATDIATPSDIIDNPTNRGTNVPNVIRPSLRPERQRTVTMSCPTHASAHPRYAKAPQRSKRSIPQKERASAQRV